RPWAARCRRLRCASCRSRTCAAAPACPTTSRTRAPPRCSTRCSGSRPDRWSHIVTAAVPLHESVSSPEHEQRLYERYMPLVRRIAMRVVRTLPANVTLDDLLSAGWLGLSEALGRRTSAMNEEQFEAYASHRVRGAI